MALFPTTPTDTLDTTVVEGRRMTINSKKIGNELLLDHDGREPPGSCLNVWKLLVCSPGSGLDLRIGRKGLNQDVVRDENGKVKDGYLDDFSPDCYDGNER